MAALPRRQHEGFGVEIRALIRRAGSDPRAKDLVGIVLSELRLLAERKGNAARHPKEDSLEGPLRGISYLRLYRKGNSLRIYFLVEQGIIWMLHLDLEKRQTSLSSGTEKLLKERREDVIRRRPDQ